MRQIFACYARLMDGVSVFVGQACSVLFFACIGISALEIVLRYGFDSPTLWSTELVMTLCASAWVLSVGFVTERQRHISITMLEILLSARAWHLFRLLQMIIASAAMIVLSMALYHPASKVLARTEYSGTAMNSLQPTYLKILLFVGCVFYLMQLLANIVHWVQRTERVSNGGY